MKRFVMFFAGYSLFVGAAAWAESISSLNTGAGLYNVNTLANAPVVDPNWSVSLLSTDPSGQTPPGGMPTGAAYLVPNDIGFPFPHWIPNDATSSWITYSTPTQVGGDLTADTFQYQVSFVASASGVDYISWLSDNSSTALLNGAAIGTSPDWGYAMWNTPIALNLTAGDSYTVDVDVYNDPQDANNPTGLRVEFTGNVGVGNSDPPAPDTASPIIYLVFALPFAAQAMRRLRQKPVAC
jgi:hypothetical protein